MPFALSPMPFARRISNTRLIEMTAKTVGAAQRSGCAQLDVLKRLVGIRFVVERVGDIAVEAVDHLLVFDECRRHDAIGQIGRASCRERV